MQGFLACFMGPKQTSEDRFETAQRQKENSIKNCTCKLVCIALYFTVLHSLNCGGWTTEIESIAFMCAWLVGWFIFFNVIERFPSVSVYLEKKLNKYMDRHI